MIGSMNRIALSLCAASAAALALASPARADFSSCVGSLRADGARAGVSRATLEAAFNGLEPDMKVLEFEKQQPEFKTPIWDYVDGLVDEERVADGKAAMAAQRPGARPRRGDLRRQPLSCWRRSGGSNSNFGTEMGKRPLVQSLSTLACFGERAGYFRSELMATLEDHRPRRHSGRQAGRLMGRRVRADAVHALELSQARGRRRRRAARHRRFGRRRARLDRQLFRQVRLALRRALGLRGQAAAGLFRPLRAQGEAADVGLGGARDRADRRAPARRRAKRACSCPPAPTARPFWSRAISTSSIPTTPPNPIRSPPACWPIASRAARASSAPWPTDDPGLSRVERRELQTLLAKKGYDVGEPDGAIGAKTKRRSPTSRGSRACP